MRWASPVTVAGPRRIRTGFPEPPTLNGRDVTVARRAMTVNLTRIYTRLGDDGETHLGDMSRVPKTHPRIEAYGTVDELNAQLGVALALPGLDERFAGFLRRVQNDLFDVGADISVPHGGDRERLRLAPEQTAWLEQACDEVNAGARAAEVVRAARRQRRPPRSCTSAAPSAGAPSGARSTAATRSTASACATSTGSPTCSSSSRARRTTATSRCGSPAATAEMEITGHGLYRAEHRALRELYAAARQLCGHWEKLAERIGGPPATVAAPRRRRRARAARRARRPAPAEHGLHGFPAAQGAGGRLAGRAQQRRRPAARAQPGDAGRGARRPAPDDAARLPRPARGDARRRAARRASTGGWEARLREVEDDARAGGDRARLRAGGGGRAGRPGPARAAPATSVADRRRQRRRGDRRLAGRPRRAPLPALTQRRPRLSRSRTSSIAGGAAISCQPRGHSA